MLVPAAGVSQPIIDLLYAWHRAQGETALLTIDGRWTGAAVIAGSAPLPDADSLTLDAITRLGPVRFVSLKPSRTPEIAFLDRDGTIIEDRDYLSDPEGVSLLPGAIEGLRTLAGAGIALVVVSNQSGVGSGRFTLEQLGLVNTRLQELLEAQGIMLDSIYSCIHRADAGCDCRKPATGLALAAATRLGMSPRHSVVIGDKPADIGLARGLGVPAFLVTTGYGRETLRQPAIKADYVVDGLDQFAQLVLSRVGTLSEDDPPSA